MALEAVQAQAGHRSIESTRVYLHLANDWLAGQARWFDRQSGVLTARPGMLNCRYTAVRKPLSVAHHVRPYSAIGVGVARRAAVDRVLGFS